MSIKFNNATINSPIYTNVFNSICLKSINIIFCTIYLYKIKIEFSHNTFFVAIIVVFML